MGQGSIDWKQHQENVDKEQEAIANNIPYAKERYDICKNCNLFNKMLRVCMDCHCFMPVKVRIQSVSCPLGKWSNIEN